MIEYQKNILIQKNNYIRFMKKTGKVTRIVENSTWKYKNQEGQTVIRM